MSRDKVLTTKRIRHFQGEKDNKYTCILIDLEISWRTTRWKDGRQSWYDNTWNRPHQCWEAWCQTIQNTLLCPRFGNNLLQGNLVCLWSNIVASSKPTKQAKSRQQNQQTWMTTTDRCYIPLEGEWAGGQYLLHNKNNASICVCVTIFLLTI